MDQGNCRINQIFVFISVLTIATTLQAHPSAELPKTRLIGGFEAPTVYGNYQASLQNLQGSHVCGGAIVSPSHVVTAAHCVEGAIPEYIKIVVGTIDLDIGGTSYNVESIQIHKNYNSTTRAHDIAVIKAEKSFNLNDIQILTLYSEELKEGDPIILTGFGALEGDSGSPLVAGNQLAGIVSWGIPCAAGFPDVHTRITHYISWIQALINKTH